MSEQQNLPPNYFYHQLPNGIEIVGEYMPSLSSITLGFQLDAAIINEPEEKPGLAHLFEYMLFQGTKSKDARALNEAFESLGVRKGASTGWETARIMAQMVNTRFDAVLPLLQEILLTPTFPREDLEQMRNDVLFAIAGKFDWDHVVQQVEQLFGDWQGQAPASPEQQPHPTGDIVLEHQEGKQEHLGLMSPFPNYIDPDYYAAMVISEVLGGNMA